MSRIEFTGGRLPPESLPVEGLIEASRAILERRGRDLIAYPFQNDTQQDLIQICAERYKHRERKSVPESEVLITTGSKQAIYLVMNQFSAPGDVILIDESSYTGSIGLFEAYGRKPIGVPMDENGMRTEFLEGMIENLSADGKAPKIIYTIPSHHNPTGVIMSLERRKQLIGIAEKHHITLLEDDCYGDVIFDDNPVPPALYTLSDSPHIFYMGSYSKILGPGLRLGYLFARPPHHAPIRSVKDLSDGGTSSLSCLVVSEYLKGRLWEHIRRHNAIIKEKQDLLCRTLRENLAGVDASWRQPRGGIFLWVKLPENINIPKLEQLADERDVAYTPGRDYSPTREELGYLRLSYAHLPLTDVKRGAEILAGCIRDACGGKTT